MSRDGEEVNESSVKTPSKLAERRKNGVPNLFLAPNDRNLDEVVDDDPCAERPDTMSRVPFTFFICPFVVDEGCGDLGAWDILPLTVLEGAVSIFWTISFTETPFEILDMSTDLAFAT